MFLLDRMAAITAVIVLALLAAYAALAWSLGVRAFLRDLAVSAVGAVPLTVAAVIVFVLVHVMQPAASAAGSAGVGEVSIGIGAATVGVALALVLLGEMLALRFVPLKTALWTIAAVAVADAGLVLSALYYYRPTIE